VALYLLNKKCYPYRINKISTIEDAYASIICENEEEGLNFLDRVRWLKYYLRKAIIPLYILISKDKIDYAKRLFEIIKSKEDVQYTDDVYDEFMSWAAEKLEEKYSRREVKEGEPLVTIEKIVLGREPLTLEKRLQLLVWIDERLNPPKVEILIGDEVIEGVDEYSMDIVALFWMKLFLEKAVKKYPDIETTIDSMKLSMSFLSFKYNVVKFIFDFIIVAIIGLVSYTIKGLFGGIVGIFFSSLVVYLAEKRDKVDSILLRIKPLSEIKNKIDEYKKYIDEWSTK
jgi:hypothetical protein